jgi:predicted metal-binding protein
MKKVVIVGCGAYMDSGKGCPGEWRCLKACAMGEGKFNEESVVISFVKCECPGRALSKTVKFSINLSGVQPDAIYISSCFANAKPGCPYATAEEMAGYINKMTGIEVVLGTHSYK